MQHTQGFTLIELVTAIIIVVILVTMAVPLYEKTVERSRLAEARTILAKLQDAKLAAMDNMECRTYDPEDSNCPKMRHLNVAFADRPGTTMALIRTRFTFLSHPAARAARGWPTLYVPAG